MRNRLRPTGFNFAEVLFAVMILGIGFIMIAAIFPVALLQTKSTMEETAATSVSRGGFGYVGASASNVTMPPVPATDGKVVPVKVGTPLWDAMKGNIVLPADPRYGAAVFYRRLPGQPIAQVTVIPTFSRNQGNYQKANPDYAFAPQPVAIAITGNRATIGGAGAASAVEGAYIIVADDGITDPPTSVIKNAGRINGHVFRLAAQTTGSAWDLMPGWDFPGYPGGEELWDRGMIFSLPAATGYIVGRGLTDPSLAPGAGNAVEGNAQDLAAYTTFVLIR